MSHIIERKRLSGPDSTKSTYHVRIAIPEDFEFSPGDSIGIFPENEPELVDEILEIIGDDSFRKDLLTKCNLQRVTPAFLDDVCEHPIPDKAERRALLTTHDLLAIIKKYPPKNLSHFIQSLPPLLPRFYSIASSKTNQQTALDLLVATFTYEQNGQTRHGVGSHFLCHGNPESLPIYLHPSKFHLPADPKAPIILIGPGTGVAPYRAFLQERQDSGPNWLFFGECHQKSDFYYADEWAKHPNLKLSLAFSRDQKEKIYVQHRLLEEAEEVWKWIQQGTYIYVCGDAKHMAKDVHSALLSIIPDPDPKAYLKALRKEGRYLLDVY